MTTAVSKPDAAFSPSASAVVLALGQFEAWRALFHPLTWLGVAGSAWMMWMLVGDAAPILPRDSVFLAGAMLPLAAATLVVANYATLRQRHLPELLPSQPSGGNKPILGVELGVAAPVLLTITLQGVGLGYLFLGGPIGPIDWWELAAGPVVVAVFGLGGVLLGRWLRHPIFAPVSLLGLGVLQLLASPDTGLFTSAEPTANFEWLAPWMMPSAFAPIEDLAARPSELHLVYLLALGMALGGLALTHEGARRVHAFALAGIFGAALVAVSFMLPTEPQSGFDWQQAATSQTCVTEAAIEYCAFDFYGDWIPFWSATIASVDSILPVQATKVLQRPPNIGFDEPGTLEAEGLILVFTEWDRHGAIPWHGFGLAVTAANATVGLPTTPQSRTWTEEEIESIVRQNPDYPDNPDNPDDDLRSILENEEPYPRSCSAVGQARTVVAVWVAATALDRGDEVLRAALGASPTSPVFWIDSAVSQNVATTIGRADAQLAEQLLDLPTDVVTDELEAHWEELLDPATRSSELASWFGLPAPSPPDPDLLVGPCA